MLVKFSIITNIEVLKVWKKQLILHKYYDNIYCILVNRELCLYHVKNEYLIVIVNSNEI